MGYKDKEKQREFCRKWNAASREEWFKNNGPCRRCWGSEKLRLYYPDHSSKTEHRVWTWKKDRRVNELKKCVILCLSCWKAVIRYEYTSLREHGTECMYSKGKCRCRLCKDAHARIKKIERIRRISNMGNNSTMQELIALRDHRYKENDILSAKIESNMNEIADLDTTIRVLQNYYKSKGTGHSEEEKQSSPPVVEEKQETDGSPENDQNIPEREEPKRNPAKTLSINIRTNKNLKRTDVAMPPVLAGNVRKLTDDYHCARCKANFSSKESLDAHNLDRHQEDPNMTQCPVTNCKKKFSTERDVEDHVLHHHPKFAAEYGYA